MRCCRLCHLQTSWEIFDTIRPCERWWSLLIFSDVLVPLLLTRIDHLSSQSDSGVPFNPSGQFAQNVGKVFECTECNKPRVLCIHLASYYGKTKKTWTMFWVTLPFLLVGLYLWWGWQWTPVNFRSCLCKKECFLQLKDRNSILFFQLFSKRLHSLWRSAWCFWLLSLLWVMQTIKAILKRKRKLVDF